MAVQKNKARPTRTNPLSPPKRGEVWYAVLNPVRGREQAGARPVLVLSADAFNASRAELVTVLPITSKAHPIATRVALTPPTGGLSSKSYVISEQVRTISRERLTKRLGVVDAAALAEVSDIVRMLLVL